MKRSEFKILSISVVALLCAACVGMLILIKEERLALGVVYLGIVAFAIRRFCTIYRSTEQTRGWQNKKGEWEDSLEAKEPNQPTQRNASTGSVSNLKSPARRG
jgi:hypothetical protein